MFEVFQKVKEFVYNNPDLVQMKESVRYPGLHVIKYKKKVFWDDLWTNELEYCRGLVVDKDFNVISRPFKKIYNFGIEERAPKLPDEAVVTTHRKVNGFMCSVSYHADYGLIVGTTGSLDSEYVDLAKEMLSLHVDLDRLARYLRGSGSITQMFEIVHPSDPHIIKELSGAYLLGTHFNYSEEYFHRRVNFDTNFNLPESLICTIGELKELNKTVRHEGFVFYTQDGQSSKIKSPWYLINKFFARKSNIRDVTCEKAREIFSEEYYPLIAQIQQEKEYFECLTEKGKLEYISDYYTHGRLYE